MSKYSTSAPTFSVSLLTSDNEFDDHKRNLESTPSSPTGENANLVISPETATTNPPQSPQSPSQLDFSNTPPSSPSSPSAKNSKQNFLSIFKKKEIINGEIINGINNASSSKLVSASTRQLVVPANVSRHNNKDTAEKITTKNNYFTTEHNVSQSVIGSVSVPNLAASNTDVSLEAEFDALMKQKQVGFIASSPNVSYGLDNGIAGEKPLNNQFKKSGKRKDNLIFTEKTDDKGFKNTMKSTMRKTSTFFKKFGNKQNSDNQLQRSRLPLPDFQDVSNPQSPSSERPQNATSSTINDTDATKSSNSEEIHLDTNDDTTISDNDCNNGDDEQESLQRTLEDYASVYANLQTDGENRRRSGSYRLSLLSANKSVPDNIGRTSRWDEQNSNNGNENAQLTNEDSKQEYYLDRRNSSNTFMSLPVIKSEKEKVKSKQVMEVISTSLEQVKEEDSENQKESRFKLNTRVSPKLSISNEDVLSSRPPISSSALEPVNTKSSFREEATTLDKRSLKINVDQRGLLMKPKRPESASGTDSGLSPSTIPKRPNKKLPDIPKTIPTSESDVSHFRSPRQASSIASSYYETASGSTTTLHTAPHSPITDALIEANYVTDGTPKIQIDDLVLAESPIDRNFDDGDSPPEVPGKDDEILWTEAKIVAKKCFNEDESFVKKEEITKYLGGHELINSRALKCYMDYYDFSNLRLDEAFRRLCGKLYIKGETQQVDRVLEAFSIRYWECNPKSIYGSSDIIHAIAYSILLLNTDLHVAQLSSKMSRSQFVRNTMATVHHAKTSMAAQNNNESYEDDQSTITSIETSTTGTSRPRRSGSIKSWRSNPSFTSGGFSRQWDSEIESLLKEMYSAISKNQILQPFLSSSDKAASVETPNTPTPVLLQRSFSHLGYPNSRVTALKKGLSAGNVKGRKNSNGRISPSTSSVSGGSDSSIGLDSLNRSGSSQTLPTTLSSFSLRHASSSETSTIPETVDEHDPDGDADDRASNADSVSSVESLSLYLSAPYAKEGLLVRKQYWESTNKRAKDKGWKECFVVIEKGDIKMYKFETNSSHSSLGLGAIGGGNWMANATLMGEVNLRHTITNALPPPGYNRSRPHVFALSMSNGGLYFFQAGTAELVNEWVATCNYWAARMSKEPLAGGVSSMEYGWGRCLGSILDSGEDWEDGKSVLSDGRSVMSANSANSSDRIVVSEWKIPLPPTVSSNFDEESQLAALKKYRTDLENELEEHKNFWEPMTKLFHPRSSNHAKAFSNWEKKSQWLLYEIVKYTTYIECINNSINIRAERRKEREKSKNCEDGKNQNDDTNTINTDEEAKKEKKRESKAKSRQSIKLFHRATWTPGDGFSLNLPKELLFGALSNLEEDDDEEDIIQNVQNGKMKSSTYPPLYNRRGIVEEEQRIGNFNNNVNYEVGQKWVDRFS